VNVDVHFMGSVGLNKEDRETLELELRNCAAGRLRKIRTGIWTILIGLISSLIFNNSAFGRLSTILTLISTLIVAYGIVNSISWFLFSTSMEKMKKDFDNGTKRSEQLKVLGYNFVTRKITLDNGLKIDSFEIHDEWKKGDLFYIEYLPISNFVLKCGKNSL